MAASAANLIMLFPWATGKFLLTDPRVNLKERK